MRRVGFWRDTFEEPWIGIIVVSKPIRLILLTRSHNAQLSIVLHTQSVATR